MRHSPLSTLHYQLSTTNLLSLNPNNQEKNRRLTAICRKSQILFLTV
ncbi:MAG: hypothetical protein LBE12_18480 [Planctomycetaceae bacterium]|nr:hypothetical protein [Planctomycetaceae bacterium]